MAQTKTTAQSPRRPCRHNGLLLFLRFGPTPELRGAGGQNLGKTGQSITPRPLERRVGLPRRERKPGVHGFCSLLPHPFAATTPQDGFVLHVCILLLHQKLLLNIFLTCICDQSKLLNQQISNLLLMGKDADYE